jgi:sigma-E factor negative regulatory protein RseC
MKEYIEGVVIQSEAETAKVRTSIHSDCDSCGVCPGNNAMIIDVTNKMGAKIGDGVLVENKSINGLLAAFIMFVLPLLAVVLGIVLGYFLSFRLMVSQKLLMIAGGVIFGLITLYFIRRLDKALQSEKPTIIKIKND